MSVSLFGAFIPRAFFSLPSSIQSLRNEAYFMQHSPLNT